MLNRTYKLPKELRQEFRKPYGKLYPTTPEDVKQELEKKLEGKKIVCVGDIISANMIKAGFCPDIIVYDLKRYRKEIDKDTRKVLERFSGKLFKVRNPPSMITQEFWKTIQESLELRKPAKIIVEGEEDLAVTPFVMEGDIDTVILYGLMDRGFVLVEIDKNIKDKVKKLLEQM